MHVVRQQRQLVLCVDGVSMCVTLAPTVLRLHVLVAEDHGAMPPAIRAARRATLATAPRTTRYRRRQRLDPLRLLAPLGDLLEVDPFLLSSVFYA